MAASPEAHRSVILGEPLEAALTATFLCSAVPNATCRREAGVVTCRFDAAPVRLDEHVARAGRLTVGEAVDMIDGLLAQIRHMAEHGKGYYGLSDTDVWRLEGAGGRRTWAIGTASTLTDMHTPAPKATTPDRSSVAGAPPTPTLQLTQPPRDCSAASPELRAVVAQRRLPARLDARCIAHSVGQVVAHALLRHRTPSARELERIRGTKIYWFLRRCFQPECRDRSLVWA